MVSLRECREYHFKITFDCKNAVPNIDQFIENLLTSKDQINTLSHDIFRAGFNETN
jgi:hypothetical protein